jgi:hypothetical protein
MRRDRSLLAPVTVLLCLAAALSHVLDVNAIADLADQPARIIVAVFMVVIVGEWLGQRHRDTTGIADRLGITIGVLLWALGWALG